MADNKDAAERRAERQDLGWLAQSAVLPRKRRAIEGA